MRTAPSVAAVPGDANQTIIFGESAGAGSVSNQVAMHKSWGLFQGAISQSGGFQRWVTKPLAEAEKNYAAVVKALSCGTGAAAVDCLVNKTAAELLAQSEAKRLPSTDGWDSCQWSPVIDGVELVAHPAVLASEGEVNQVPVLLGTNADEGTEFVSHLSKQANASALRAWAQEEFPGLPGAWTLQDAHKHHDCVHDLPVSRHRR